MRSEDITLYESHWVMWSEDITLCESVSKAEIMWSYVIPLCKNDGLDVG